MSSSAQPPIESEVSAPKAPLSRPKIGVFDSGIGGATVLAALRARFPIYDFSYFGDTANVPYGPKSSAQICALSESAALRMVAHRLDALVVACNTASSWALPNFQKILGSVPVFGMVESGVEAVRNALLTDLKPVVVFGTQATIRSGVYGKYFKSEIPAAQVLEQACPLLVPMIEEGWKDHEILRLTLAEYVAPAAAISNRGVALLACTHYPWIRDFFQAALPLWTIIDSAESVTERLARELKFTDEVPAGRGKIEWYFSDPDAVASFVFESAIFGDGGEVVLEIRPF